MKIKIEKSGDSIIADMIELPGTPPIGRGVTETEAIARLFWSILLEQNTWLKYLDLNSMSIIRESNEQEPLTEAAKEA